MQTLLKEIIDEHGAIIFNGDGYSEAWHQEAAKRGLPNLKTHGRRPADAADAGGHRAVREVQRAQPSARPRAAMDIYLEQYCKTVNVEAKLTIEMAKTMIFPAAIRYQGELAVDLREPEGGRLRRSTPTRSTR